MNSAEEHVLSQLVAARLDQAPEILLRWHGRDGLSANLERHLSEEVRRLSDRDLAELFARHCPVVGAEPDDYRMRWLAVPGFGRALVGIRFRGLDLSRPFVTVVASTRLPRAQGELTEAVVQLKQEFERFSPRHLRVFVPAGMTLEPSGGGQFWEKRLLAGKVSDLLRAPRPSGFERVELRPATDTGWYHDYEAAFQELVESEPAYLEYTRLEAEEDLAELTAKGLVFELFVDGDWAGITAVDEDGTEGVEGYLMIEILLAGHARGKGLGTAVYRQLMEHLPEPSKILLGTIDARNGPAIRAASRLGRVDVGGYLWVPVDRWR